MFTVLSYIFFCLPFVYIQQCLKDYVHYFKGKIVILLNSFIDFYIFTQQIKHLINCILKLLDT